MDTNKRIIAKNMKHNTCSVIKKEAWKEQFSSPKVSLHMMEHNKWHNIGDSMLELFQLVDYEILTPYSILW